jgi:hypothetical protein
MSQHTVTENTAEDKRIGIIGRWSCLAVPTITARLQACVVLGIQRARAALAARDQPLGGVIAATPDALFMNIEPGDGMRRY